ncbi:MAG: hypothetical protein ABIP94_22390, partial [Planctomycetota bacterium]
FPDGGKVSFSTKTAADGSFTSRELVPAGRFEFGIEQRGIELVDTAVDIAARAEPNVVLLHGRRLPSIRGVVFGPDGVPCKGVALQAEDPTNPPPFDSCGDAVSASDGSFEVFRKHGEAEQVCIRPSPTAAYELVGEPIPYTWGTAGLRLEVRHLVPVQLRVLDADTRQPIETFAVLTTRRQGIREVSTGSISPGLHEGGLVEFEGLAVGTRILLWSAGDRATAALFVDESMARAPTVDVLLARLQPFALTLVDTQGHPVAIELHVLDRLRATEPQRWTDPRTGRFQSGHCSLRLSTATTDARGEATLMAPVDRRELGVALRRGDHDIWLPLTLPASGQPIRLILPN